MIEIKGLAGARGKVLLKAVVLDKRSPRPERGTVSDPEQEIARFEAVRATYTQDLLALQQKALGATGQEAADIMKAYADIAGDHLFFKKPIKLIGEEGVDAPWAVAQERDKVCGKFSAMEDEYMKSRADDIRNVCDELIRRLCGIGGLVDSGEGAAVFVAEDLTPEDTVRLDKSRLGGFITERGGVTSHAVILAKTLGIPAVVGASGILGAISSGQRIYLDGDTGVAVIDPDEQTIASFHTANEAQTALQQRWQTAALHPAVTKDGHRVSVCVNSGDTDSLKRFQADQCDGVGLFRTEFLFMDQSDYPSEELQYQAYRMAAEAAQGKEVIIRTLDIGGDKQLGYMELPREDNPFLGYRAIRICLDREQVFLTQLRALLRAALHGQIKIMFPMIVTLEELRQAKAMVARARENLTREGIPCAQEVPLGIMIETPAAVLMSDALAEEADFFSIGTNDLIQYTTATDRMNERVQYLYDPCNLSVLRSIHKVIENGHKAGIPVGMCGEVASDERLLPLLLAMGLDEFSVVPAQVGRVKSLIQNADFAALGTLPEQVLRQREIDEVKRILKQYEGMC